VLEGYGLNINEYLTQYAEDPKHKEATIVISLSREEISGKIRTQSLHADNIIPELKKIKNGLDYIQIIDSETPFLDKSDFDKIAQIQNILGYIDNNKIFVSHGLEKWPSELNKKTLKQAITDYCDLIDKALNLVKNPVVQIKTVIDTPLNLDIGTNPQLRTQALLDLHIPDSVRTDSRINSVSIKTLTRRINRILKVLDNNSSQFDEACKIDHGILLDQSCYANFIKRMSILNFISTNTKGDHDPFLACDLRQLCLQSALHSTDKEFFELCRVVRINIEKDKLESHAIEINDDFKNRVFPKQKHPLEDLKDTNNPTLHELTKFLLGKDSYTSQSALLWKEHPTTAWAIRQAIILKLKSNSYVDSPKEDWIKANFPKGINSMIAQQLKTELQNLIKEGVIAEKAPGKPKTGIKLSRQ
jgi:hypothetical protein